MGSSNSFTQRFSIHGVETIIRNKLPALGPAIERALGEFIVPQLVAETTPREGLIRPYDKTEVLRYLSPTAIPLGETRGMLELYQDNELFWLIDDRFGLVEINMLKSQWRSWIIPEPTIDLDQLVESAVLWPLAQLSRGRGVHLLPAAGVLRGDSGLLIIAPLNIEAELCTLLRAGYRLIGQSWVALRDNHDRIEMLHMPGRVSRQPNLAARALTPGVRAEVVDLETEFCGSATTIGACDTILLVEPGRRPTPQLRQISPSSVLPTLRHAWPIPDLHPHRVAGQMPVKIARRCKVYSTRLSPRPQDLLNMLDAERARELDRRVESAAIHQTNNALARHLANAAKSLAG